MTARELLLHTLRGAKTERIAIAPFIHVNFVKAFFHSDDVDVVPATVEVYRHFGFDIIHRNCTPACDELSVSTVNWRVSCKTMSEGRDQTTTTIIATPRGELRQVHRVSWISRYDCEASPVEYLLKSETDFETIRDFMPPVPRFDTSDIVRAREATGDCGITAPWMQGVFNYAAYFYCRVDDLIMYAMLRPESYHQMMSYFLERNKEIASQLIAADPDVLSYGGNIASGKMMDARFFREFVFPYERQLIDWIQSRGVPVLYHNCGWARKLFGEYRDLGMAAYESLTGTPYGDSTIDEAFRVFSPDQVLCGNIDQIDFLMNARPDEVRGRVRDLLDEVQARGCFIVSTTDYLHESTPHENVRALAEIG